MSTSTTDKTIKLTCTNPECKKEFIVIAQEATFYEQKKLPLPDHCPACRHKQRMALRSERQLYKRTCDKCKKQMVSVYPESAPYLVYCNPCFWENIE
jgi:Zn ribbon nucleic-acid-binding protein